MRKALTDLIFLGVVKEDFEVANHVWTLQTLTAEEQLEATNATGNYTEYISKVYSLTIEILARAIKSIDNEVMSDKAEAIELVKQMQPVIVNKLYEHYQSIQDKANKSLESIEEIKPPTTE
jgi:hypothetical protein